MRTSARTVDRSLDWYNRYARHIALDEVGEAGQIALNESSVLIVGAGGLGSPAALYLAAAGVGTLGLIDFDTVSLNNLQRQILHGTKDVGIPKIASATRTLTDINPGITINTWNEMITPDNIWDRVTGHDLVLDASDNFATRYLINDVCVQTGTPQVFGAVLQFSGQVTVFTQEEDSACYRCLFPVAPAPELAPSCTEAGIFGVTPGIIGSLQASQALIWLLGAKGFDAGAVLKNRLLLYDGQNTTFRSIKVSRNPSCPVCSDNEFDYRQVEYSESCAVNSVATSDGAF